MKGIVPEIQSPVLVEGDLVQPEACGGGRRRKVLIGMAAVLLVVLGAVVGAVFASGDGGGSESNSKLTDCRRRRRRLGMTEETVLYDENNIRALQTDAPFLGIGCFRTQFSEDRHEIQGSTEMDKAAVCSDRCLTLHFGIAGNTCYCYVDAPQERLAIGSCSSACEAPEEKMEAYFKSGLSGECSQPTTTAVRNMLVEEDDAPFGYDIVRNQWRPSPFELYKDECGTNIYEVQTEVSEGSKKLSTDVQDIKEFAKERRSSLSRSISASASASYKSLFVKASAKVSASYDSEQSAMFRSSGADMAGSKVFTSLGVKRIAEVRLVDFNNKRHFVTFSREFGKLLRNYRDSNFANETAAEIFNTYGMFVMSRGIFGGFMQYRATATKSAVDRFFASEEDARQCFEASVSASAKVGGFSGSAEVGVGQCTQEASSEMENLQNSYASETSEQEVVGGIAQDGDFTVPPDLSQLLTTKDKYPPGDSGIELRILSDFLSPEMVSPLEVKRYLLTEKDFADIHDNLERHILEELQRIESILDECGGCEVPYLEQTDTGFVCACYNPSGDVVASESTLSVGAYSSHQVTAPCGLASETRVIGGFDNPSAFELSERTDAQLLWFTQGYVEYHFPNNVPSAATLNSLSLSLELSSEYAGQAGSAAEWPSDITVWVNGVEIGIWTSPADFVSERGNLTPAWWNTGRSQYGLLKTWSVTTTGTFVDEEEVSAVIPDELNVSNNQDYISVRIGVKADATNVGGINIYGEKYGNHAQDLVLSVNFTV